MKEMLVPMNAPDWMPHKAETRRAKRTLDHLIRANTHSRREQASSNASRINVIGGGRSMSRGQHAANPSGYRQTAILDLHR